MERRNFVATVEYFTVKVEFLRVAVIRYHKLGDLKQLKLIILEL